MSVESVNDGSYTGRVEKKWEKHRRRNKILSETKYRIANVNRNSEQKMMNRCIKKMERIPFLFLRFGVLRAYIIALYVYLLVNRV